MVGLRAAFGRRFRFWGALILRCSRERLLRAPIRISIGEGDTCVALVKCKECGAEISSEAKVCPHCGKSAPKKTSGRAMAVAIILGVGIAGTLARRCSESTPQQTTATSSGSTSAGAEAEQAKAKCLENVRLLLHTLPDMNLHAVADMGSAFVVVDVFSAGSKLYRQATQMKLASTEAAEVEALRAALVKSQVKAFPVLRMKVGPFMNKGLWEANATARTFGPGYTSVEFVAAEFASHQRIQQTEDGVHSILVRLRFKKAHFKWMPSADESWEYSIDSPPDNILAAVDEHGAVTYARDADVATSKRKE